MPQACGDGSSQRLLLLPEMFFFPLLPSYLLLSLQPKCYFLGEPSRFPRVRLAAQGGTLSLFLPALPAPKTSLSMDCGNPQTRRASTIGCITWLPGERNAGAALSHQPGGEAEEGVRRRDGQRDGGRGLPGRANNTCKAQMHGTA